MEDLPHPERATVASLARRAGVATSTVSRALRNDPRISPEVRARIIALAAEVGYTPNALARTLVSGRSGLIGLVLGPMDNPFYAEMMQQIVSQAAARGWRLLLLHAGAGPIEDATAAALLQYRVDGCLITSAELSSRAASVCAENRVPLVMVNRVAREHGSAVSCDNLAAGETLADLLMEAGYRRLAVITGNPGTSTGLERAEGFVRRVVAAGLPAPLLLPGGASHAAGYAAGQAMAALPAEQRPDAVMGVSDILAMGAMDALREAGLSVPGDVSVVGVDGIAAAGRAPYRLTTVAQPLEAMIARGLDMLLARIGGTQVPEEVVLLRGSLIRRASARLVAPGQD
ncbi:LacI family DNA-binding transcriptional regulator [Pseudoroseomonas wenyumeiae]|uniref:LacI family DNA-binding transcriptional regulator n=1 Tax=Teichococcus wenyumeiae TaxID=2478470 RepID=A0A3A9JMV2_9PROT|nr:LacI family DNA-binding transcriptional regulator [Pseudoroseomonas wenyumeiae]RKK05064.1 LacI family transcriptional regulator [Pseudoroseomonas wenyumeiae]RMI25062.1 LacI family DNA-binding transcriptional regulator [Pseudoroseomonas wenyumeiae]